MRTEVRFLIGEVFMSGCAQDNAAVDVRVYGNVNSWNMSTTIRVNESTHDRLSALATATHQPMTAVVDEALEALEHQRFFESFNDDYRRLRDDPETWAAVEEERVNEAGTLADRSS